MPTNLTVNIKEAHDAIVKIMKSKLVPMLVGSPGLGKSDLTNGIAEEFNMKLIDFRLAQCDPTDLLGFPHIDKETGKASYVPMSTFPLEGDELPPGKDGWILFLDEMSHADRSVQKASYKLILDRMVGERKLHPKVAIIAAGNLDTDNAFTEEMSSALKSRMVHLELRLDSTLWLEWAVDNDIDHRIISYIRFKSQNLHRFDPESVDKTYPCPRTWEFASRLIKNETKIDKQLMTILAGTISQGAATEFRTFTKIYKDLITVPEILKDPKGATVPKDPPILYALTGSIANYADKDNMDDLVTYITRMPIEFQVVTLRDMIKRDGSLLRNPAVMKWSVDHRDKLFG